MECLKEILSLRYISNMSCGNTVSPLTNGKEVFLEKKKAQYLWNMFEGVRQ